MVKDLDRIAERYTAETKETDKETGKADVEFRFTAAVIDAENAKPPSATITCYCMILALLLFAKKRIEKQNRSEAGRLCEFVEIPTLF